MNYENYKDRRRYDPRRIATTQERNQLSLLLIKYRSSAHKEHDLVHRIDVRFDP